VRRPGLEPGAVSLEASRAIHCASDAHVGRQGIEPQTKRGLKVRRSTTELTARRYQRPAPFTRHHDLPSWGGQDLNLRVSCL
jgi:hypothetical protein